MKPIEIDHIDATLTHRRAVRLYATAEKLLRSARAFADLVVGTSVEANAQRILERSMVAMNEATMTRLRAAQNVSGVVEAMRSEGLVVPVIPEAVMA